MNTRITGIIILTLLLACLPALCISAWATTYYVDSQAGSDTFDGRSETFPIKTIAKVNTLALQPGDSVLFKRGGIWYEPLIISSSGFAKNPITFGAYGTGALPIISGANIISGFFDGGSNIWDKTGVSIEPIVVFIDGVPGTKVANRTSCTSPYTWYWMENTLSVYATSDPSGTVVASQRDHCIYIDGANYVIIDGIRAGQSNVSAARLRGGAANVILENCVFTHTGGESVGLFHEADNSSILNCTISYSGFQGIMVSSANNIIISNNSISYTQYSGISWGSGNDGIQINNNDISHCALSIGEMITLRGTNFQVYANTVHDNTDAVNSGEGIDVLHGTNGEIYNNYIHDTKAVAIYLDGANNVKVYNNFIINPLAWGIACTDETGGYGLANLEIYNNILIGSNVNSTSALVITDSGFGNNLRNISYYNNTVVGWQKGISIAGTGHSGIIFKNNIILGTSQYCINSYLTSGLTLDYNCYYSISGKLAYWGGTVYTLAQFANYQAASKQDAHSISADPLFVSASDFHLQAGSPAIKAGENGVTMGAYEYSESEASVSVNQPPLANEQSFTINEDNALIIALKATDPENDALTYSLVTLPAYGTLSGTAPNLIYTPNLNYNGSDVFSFKVNDGTSDSSPANVYITILLVNDPPSTPQGLNATVISQSQINLTWSASSDPDTGDALTYNLYRNSSTVPLNLVSITATSYSDTGLQPNTTYSYQVEAVDTTGAKSAKSASVSAATLNTTVTLNAPTNLTATALRSGKIKLSWQDKSNNESGFKIMRSTDKVNFSKIATLSANVTTYTNYYLTAGRTYYYKVCAYNSSENSAYSNTASAKAIR